MATLKGVILLLLTIIAFTFIGMVIAFTNEEMINGGILAVIMVFASIKLGNLLDIYKELKENEEK